MAEPVQPVDSCDQYEPAVRLAQYLYVGKEYPNYQPGDWFVHKYYQADRVQSISTLARGENPLVAIEVIQKAFESKMVQNPETLVYALAVCARQSANVSLSHAAYAAVKTICATPDHFFLFNKFASEYGKSLEDPKHGWGRGWKTAVNDWYLSKEPIELAKCVTRYRGRHGWTHKDIIKLAHTKTNDIAKQAVLKYVLFNLTAMVREFRDKPEAAEVIKYIQSIENFKHCEDGVIAGRLVEIFDLSLEHVPGHLLKTEEVWNSLIPSMSLTTLLNNLQRIHNTGILVAGAPAVDKIIDAITDADKVVNEKIHPAFVLGVLRNYEKSGKPLTYEKQKSKAAIRKPSPRPHEPNRAIIEALYKTLASSFDSLEPTGLQYLITIDMNKPMQEKLAWHGGNVSAVEAGCLIALCLLRCEANVTIGTFKTNGIQSVKIDKTISLGQIVGRMKRTLAGRANLEKPMNWAGQNKKTFDVFINVVDEIEPKNGKNVRIDYSRKAIDDYRKKMSLPNAKLVNCAIASSSTGNLSEPTLQDKNVMTICGFDQNVPKVIEAFARSLF